MDSEAKIIIAFLFKRSGKERLNYSDLYLTLSMDLNWFTPDEAKAFVDNALNQKLLTLKDKLIKPNFNVDEITIPTGFHPTKQLSEEKEKKLHEKQSILATVVKRIAEKTDLDDESIMKKIKATEKEKDVTPEVAALLVGKEHEISLEDFFDEIERNLFTKNRE